MNEPGPTQTAQLELSSSDAQAGFRLHRFEVYNWGTFHERIWAFQPRGDNILLTGDIGSGKSTLVDALSTLLVPPQKIIYNKAAGAEARERNLRSYVLGFYKSERTDIGLAVKAVALRDHNNYSVILAHFRNEGYGQDVTLAQVYWLKDAQGPPARLYAIADSVLSIAVDFAGFGSDLNALRKRLRATPGVELHDSFPPYGAAFRRRFGIDNEQALDLFNQTVSMKSVGNLTDFVRSHMLEAFPVEERIQALIHHFDDLNRAHEAVLKANAQIDRLRPLVADCEQHAALSAQSQALLDCREALRPWFASLKAELLDKRLASLEVELTKLAGRIEDLSDKRRARNTERDDKKRAIAENGGDRIERIKADIAQNQAERDARSRRAEQYGVLARATGLSDPGDAEAFAANVQRIANDQEIAEARQAELQNQLTELQVAFKGIRDKHEELATEIDSLRQRRSNIPSYMLRLRDSLCSELTLDEEGLPFVGELIQVRDDERAWEGAAERLLHNFGLSLLVPDASYARVAAWVDRAHLGARLVYYRVRGQRAGQPAPPQATSLVRKLAVKPDSEFFAWLEAELARRFDVACCDTLEQFQREPQAITRAGQVKHAGERHEKDDRHAIDDRTRYVLGWSNEAKLAALMKQAQDLEARARAEGTRIAAMQTDLKTVQERIGRLKQLAVFETFRDLDWRPLVAEIDRLDKERRRLEDESDILRTLTQQLEETENELRQVEDDLERSNEEQTRKQERRDQAQAQRRDCEALLAAMPEDAKTRHFPRLETMRAEALGERGLSVESCDNRQAEMREWLQAKIDAEAKRIARLRDAIIEAMSAYKGTYPLETQDADVSVAAAEEYRAMLRGLEVDDLPRFEARFKELLNENTIREIANFQSQLGRERQTIRERIDAINRSLRGIDYNPGRYIKLEIGDNPDAEIRDFQRDLRACTEGSLTGSGNDAYSEAKFLEVKRIIERFRGREGTTELDRRWTRKVTDVRGWFEFSASERWREDDTEHEHYSDSGGKSGGQKEKLAYTVLAASLAYQFGLEWGETRSRSFRFVVIDEAFGRGSDESAAYGLELFKRLNLQVLVVTPLQKIHVIEPYVAGVGFVHSDDGSKSFLRNLSIQEYHAEQAARGV